MKPIGQLFSQILDDLSEFLAERKGLLPLIGALLVVINLLLEIFFPALGITRIDLLLHLGVILAVFGVVLARAL